MPACVVQAEHTCDSRPRTTAGTGPERPPILTPGALSCHVLFPIIFVN